MFGSMQGAKDKADDTLLSFRNMETDEREFFELISRHIGLVLF